MRKGLTTSEALQKLYEDIRQATDDDEKQKEFNISQFLNFFNPKLWNWPLQYSKSWHSFERVTLIILALEVLALVISYIFHPGNSSQAYLAEAFLLTALGTLNVSFLWWDDQLRRTEMRTRTRWILDFLQDVRKKCQWRPEHYPHIHSPPSPSITLQPTIRDGDIVNLPWALLVKGDIIILRPGQAAPGRCKSIEDENMVLECEEIFAPANEDDLQSFSSPRMRKPFKCFYCVLEETPFINSLKIVLKEALNRPNSVFQKEKYLIFTICLEHVASPVFLLVLTVLNAIRYLYSSTWLSSGHWTDMFLIDPCSVILPLIPLVLPVAWLIINAFGLAWILALFYTARQYKVSNDPFEETEMTSPTHSTFWGKCREMKPYFLDTLLGRGKSPFRTANLLQTLASVTALCCVDKKGILSWPNPTAEKVFFLRNSSQGFVQDVSPISSSPDQSTVSVQEGEKKAQCRRRRKRSRPKSEYGVETTAEVLDLSHDCTAPFRLQFDDPSWQQYIGSLKPLGLAILLNTCNPKTQERYAQFCSHLSCLSLHHEDLIPVTNRRECNGDDRVQSCVNDDVYCTTPTPGRTTVSHVTPMPILHGCLCELAKQIGFSAGARNIFSIKDQLFTFKHQADLARKDRLARSLSLPKLKFPFPNMVGICVQESTSGRLQLLSQGTGEILLDSCVDYWNGSDLCPLTVADRKRILDFYNRTSLTAYCTAFAYRPLTNRLNFSTGCRQGADDQTFDSTGVYLELPADSAHLYQPQRSPTPAWDSATGNSGHSHGVRIHSDGNLYNLGTGFLSRSNDSLLPNESAAESAEPVDGVQSAENMFQVQCNQTFVAMVTMQYQARTDMVQLIEQLDQACIRFVHFSKENELRSRVFSEKMGLESGWNCHISLLSEGADGRQPVEGETTTERKRHKSVVSLVGKERDDVGAGTGKNLEHTRPLSVPAPSAINMEMAQVKFEDEISLYSLTADSDDSDLDPEDAERERLFPQTLSVKPAALQTPSPHRHQLVASGSGDRLGSMERCSSRSSAAESSSSSSVMINVGGGGSSCWDVNLSRSQSHVTESTEQSAPVAFDLSNRAKLPRGIEEIRPHIERVDNVPLLVSLFTDCTPSATREMIQIMQENGEVVCIVGSSASSHNAAIFMQADASLAVEPLYPQVCQQVNVCSPVTDVGTPSPVELSRRLNSLPCALSFHRDELPSSLLHLVLESRHVGLCLRNVLQLWAAASVSLSTLQLGAALLFLPPVLTTGQVLWMSCLTVPILSTSMMGAPTDSRVMNIATGKNVRSVDKETVSFVAWSYGLKFVPSIFVLLLIYCTSLIDLCAQLADAEGSCYANHSTFDGCVWVYPTRNGNVVTTSLWSGWGDDFKQLHYKIQHCIALAFVLYLVFVSMSFIHRHSHFWQRNPFSNRLWIISSALVIGLQVIYFAAAISLDDVDQKAIGVNPHRTEQCRSNRIAGLSWPLPLWLGLAWPVLLVAFNELVKYYEIKMNVRLQKRARLEFGTKLGMNSPF